VLSFGWLEETEALACFARVEADSPDVLASGCRAGVERPRAACQATKRDFECDIPNAALPAPCY
jgi:hypothetical protein